MNLEFKSNKESLKDFALLKKKLKFLKIIFALILYNFKDIF
jgi:hypothetical protein